MKELFKNVFKSNLVKQSGTTFILRSFGFFLGYLFIILVSRLYGADAVGVFSLTTTVLLMFTIIGKMGTDTAIVKYVSKFLVAQNHNAVKGLYQTVLKLIFTSGIFLSLILFFCAEPFALYVFKKTATNFSI
ncbi:MAG: oligosaccharide flippase family protein [Bacteroidetes bacterium]|nr:oligosaccharide flippase family protein [Bacteroidota bacterium]